MADEQRAVFSIDLKDGTSASAENAADALKRLRDQIDRDQKSLREMQRAMKNLQGGTSVNIQQFRQLRDAIDAKKRAIAGNTSEVLAMGGSLRRTGARIREVRPLLDQVALSASQIPGPLANVTSRLVGVRAVVAGGALLFGIIVIADAFLALATGAVTATVALARYAISQGSAARAERLRLEGMTKLRNWYGIAAGSASELQAMIDRVSSASALGRDEVARYSQQLYRAHLRGQNLSDALQLVTTVASTQGQEIAKRYAGWAASLNLAGGSVKRLAADVQARLGGIAKRQLLDLDVQAMKAKESLAALFGDLPFEGFLGALNEATSLLSQTTVTGRAIKTLMESVFGPLDQAASRLGPIVKRFFQGMVIVGLLVAIAVLKVRNAFRDVFGDGSFFEGVDVMKMALLAGVFAVSMMAGALATLALVAAVIAAPFLLVADVIWGAVNAIAGLYDMIVSINWSSLGSAIIDGIVNGLSGGSSYVIDAVRKLGESAWGAFKTTLGIASPSKEFAKLGLAIPQGVEQGIDAGEPSVRRSAGDLVEVPSVSGASGVGSGASVSITFGDVIVNGSTPVEQVDDFRRRLESVLETVAIQLGARLQGAT